MFGPKRHENLAKALRLHGDALIVDLGCGTADTMAALAARLGSAAVLIGIDRQPSNIASLREGDRRLKFVVADLEHPFPVRSGVFDAAVCHNTLEWLIDKSTFLDRAAAVLKPNGVFLLGHSDFDTMVFAGSDLDLTRRFVHAYADDGEAAMHTVDGTIGRRLLALARMSSLDVVRAFAWVGVHTTFVAGSPARAAADAVARVGRSRPDLADAVDGWLMDLEAADARGEFLYSINDYALLLRKPK